MSKELKLDPSKIYLRGIISPDFIYTNNFKCGNGSMNLFLSTEAYISHINRESSTTLVMYDDKLAGYFTLHREKLKSEIPFDDYTNDTLSLDRLAVSLEFQNKGLGTYLVNKIIEIAFMTNEMYIQAYAVFERWKWYYKLGFKYIFEDDIDENKNDDGLVYMILELLDEKLIEEYLEI
jgi:GNAT superfamily N-acetyltransferase